MDKAFGPRGLHLFLATTLALLLAACGGGGADSASEPPAAVARIEVTPAAALLTAAGAVQAFRAQAYDAAGRPLDVPVAWSSSRPAQVEVDGAGRATARVAAGSAQISASAGGVRSAPVLALAATPAAGVVLVEDTQIVTEATDTEPDAVPADANTYAVTLGGLPAPAVGTRLLGRGAKALAGEVTAVSALSATQHRVTLRLVPLAQLFERLEIDETFALSPAEAELAPEVAAQFEVERSGTRWRFVPRPGALAAQRKAATAAGTAATTATASLPPFRNCESTLAVAGLSANPLSLDPPSFDITIAPRLEVRHDSVRGLERLLLRADPELEIGLGLKARERISGSLKCSLQLFALRLPIAGPLSFFIGGVAPVGVGFEFEAATEFASAGLGVTARAVASTRAGIECLAPAGCAFVREISDTATTLQPRVDIPELPADLRLTGKLHAFAYLEAELGNPLLRSLRFKGFDARVGAELSGRFAPPLAQLLDTGFSASHTASLRGRARVGTGIDNILRLLSLGTVSALALEIERPLAHSPRVISVPAQRASFAAGDTVELSVLLDPATLEFLPGVYNVESVQLLRRVDGAVQQIATQAAGSGQSRFDFSVVAPHAGQVGEWVAFVTTRLLPAGLLSLELAPAAVVGAEVLLQQAGAGGVASCFAQAREFDLSLNPIRNLRDAFEQKAEGEANPAACSAQAWEALATASGSAQGSGPFQDSSAPPTPVSSLVGTGSAQASASSTPWIDNEPIQVRRASSAGAASGGGAWVLRVQGSAVTMAMSGTLAGYARFRATWAPAAGGAGTAGSYLRDPFTGGGAFSHSVRLEPGQTVSIEYGAQARALSPAAAPSPTDPFEPGPAGGSASVSVSFTPE